MRRVRGLAAAAASLAVLVGTLAIPGGAAQAAENLKSTDNIAGIIPEPDLPELNDPNCKLTPSHPRPVVLVHGLGATARENWNFFAPYLAAEGYCVYGRTYGQHEFWPGRGGIKPMETSANQLSDFVDQVMKATGAKQVDMVGHSEGGIMPRYYLKFLGGSKKVRSYIAWAPPSHGTNLSGLAEIRHGFPGWESQMAPFCGSCPEFMPESNFIRTLNAGDETPGTTKYTVIATRYDQAVTPFTTSFLKGAKNILLQDIDSSNYVDHVGMAWDALTFQLTLSALNKS
jgi:triacylglycerol esterase/lipase EstA (alpha/beta hydrolase family)